MVKKSLVLGSCAVLVTLGITGCGGSSSSTQTQTVTGVVADGPLEKAKVCLDLNDNRKCDTTEPSTETGVDGGYSLSNVTGSALKTHAIVVEVTTASINHEGSQAIPITKPYVLSTPPDAPKTNDGKVFVSPLTTLIHTQMESNPALTVTDAEKVVKTNIGAASTTSLFENFVAKKAAGGADAQEYEKVGKVAQVVAAAVSENLATIKTAAPSADLNSIIKVIVEQVITKLSEISGLVDTATTFNPSQIASTTSTIDTTNITQQLAEASTATAASSFKDALSTTGFYFIEGENYNNYPMYYYGFVKLGSQLTDGSYNLTESEFRYSGGAWTEYPSTYTDYRLTATGWLQTSDNAAAGTVAFNSDGTATWTIKATKESEKIQVTEMDVSDQLIAPFVAGEGITVNKDAKFAKGAKAYKMTFTPLQDQYRLWTGDSYLSNYTSLEQFMTATAQGYGIYVGNYLSVKAEASSSTATSGTLSFYYKGVKQTTSGTWKKAAVNGQDVLVVKIPLSYRTAAYSLEWLEPSEDLIYSTVNGRVMQGSVRYAGVPQQERSKNFNKTAIDNILASFVAQGGTPTGSMGGTAQKRLARR